LCTTFLGNFFKPSLTVNICSNIGPNSGYPCSDSLNAKSKRDSVLRLKDAVLTAISPEQDGYAEIAFLNMLTEEYDEVARVRLLHEVVSAICKVMRLILNAFGNICDLGESSDRSRARI
ncbi:hypothetical protein OESDEN_06734, partial [Oesophagostomum dentatum]